MNVTESIVGIIKESTAQSVLVEAAHVYGYQTLEEMHLHGAQIGAKVVSLVNDLGLAAKAMLFVDDYNWHQQPSPKSYIQNPETFHNAYLEKGFKIDTFAHEAILAAQAEAWVTSYIAEGIFKVNKKGVFLPLGHDGILWIVKKNHLNEAKFTCEALDALCYINKSKLADLLITVLPVHYTKQQDRTKLLLKKLGYRLPILNIYFEENGDLNLDFEY